VVHPSVCAKECTNLLCLHNLTCPRKDFPVLFTTERYMKHAYPNKNIKGYVYVLPCTPSSSLTRAAWPVSSLAASRWPSTPIRCPQSVAYSVPDSHLQDHSGTAQAGGLRPRTARRQARTGPVSGSRLVEVRNGKGYLKGKSEDRGRIRGLPWSISTDVDR
jgi:hypothetical protein